ncbi:diguanylate cyclase [Sphingomonas sp. CJ20]
MGSHNDIAERKSARRIHLWGFGALGALAVLLAAMTVNVFDAAADRRQAEALHLHTLRVLLTAGKTGDAINDALRGEGGYLLTHDPLFLRSYIDGRRETPRLFAELRALTAENPRQHANMRALGAQLDGYFAVLRETLTFEEQGDLLEAVATIRDDMRRRDIQQIQATLGRIEAEERRVLAIRERANERAVVRLEETQIALAGLAMCFLLVSVVTGIAAARARAETLATQARLRHAAASDELTGLPNRRAFLAALDAEIARTQGSDAPLSLAMIDVDHFKAINDNFGHQAGDDVLRSFAAALPHTLGAHALPGRLGGEEFGILMPETDGETAGQTAERICQAIAALRPKVSCGVEVPLTVSIGIARFHPGESRDGLLARADAALYEAKGEGRNRVRLAA